MYLQAFRKYVKLQGWLKNMFCVFVNILFVEEHPCEKLYITDETLGQDFFFLLQETVYKKSDNLN